MKRLFFLLLIVPILLAADNIQLARMNPYVAGCVVVGSAGCTTSNHEALHTFNTSPTASDTTVWMASKIDLGSNSTITQYSINICRTGTHTENYTISLYNDNSNKPGTEIADTQATIANSSLADCYTYNNLTATLATPKAVSSGTIWIVAKQDHGYMRWSRAGDSVGTPVCGSTDSGANWTCTDQSSFLHVLMGCTP